MAIIENSILSKSGHVYFDELSVDKGKYIAEVLTVVVPLKPVQTKVPRDPKHCNFLAAPAQN